MNNIIQNMLNAQELYMKIRFKETDHLYSTAVLTKQLLAAPNLINARTVQEKNVGHLSNLFPWEEMPQDTSLFPKELRNGITIPF